MLQKERKLTSKQDELRLSGLRIPARIIARSHLGLVVKEAAARSRAPRVRAHRDCRPLGKDGGHVR